jgi:outer membrane protein insertion porin family
MTLALAFWLPKTAYALETVRVLVLPFDIYSQEDLAYLGNEVPKALGSQLTQEGASVVGQEIVDTLSWKEKKGHVDDLRSLCIETGADYVIWGSMTWIGRKFSIDAKLVKAFGKTPPETIYVAGEGIENLSGTMKTLSQNLGLKLFKREKVAKIQVVGQRRIEKDAIERKIKTKPGEVFLAQALSEDLKAVYAMGYFEDIRIEADDGPDGKIITFHVEEKPTLRVIRISGNKVYDDDEIKEDLTIKTGSILNIFMIQRNVRRIEELYREKNYHNVKVTYAIHELSKNQADLEFVVEEGVKIRIKTITFEGNTAFDNKELKKLMKTSEKGFWYWLTASGELNEEDLNQDANKIAAYYHNNGYIQAKVGEPQTEYIGDWIYVKVKIDEGPRFKVGTVDVQGELVLPEEEMLAKLKITEEEYYNREVVRNDTLVLSDLYSDEGYAYADISPNISQDAEALVVNITYTLKKGKEIYFERIIISGNTRTRDKVIRRQLSVYEQEKYSGVRLKKGIQNLYRLDYFEDIKVNTVKGTSDDKMILKIDVAEKPTGFFSVGGGYSSIENMFAVGSVTERNLFGRGQTLQFKAEVGGTSTRYTLSFTEPWLFDIPLSAGADLYNWEYEYDTYDKDSIGGRLRFGYQIFEDVRSYLYYRYDIADVKNIDEDEASDDIKDLEGINVTSSITNKWTYDTRDRLFSPTKGQNHSVGIEYAGGPLGGDMAFTKYLAETGVYIPLFLGTTGFLHAEGGFVHENPGGKLPDYERFYLGGMNSVRGFDSEQIHALDDDGNKIGGEKYLQLNVEYIVPLVKEAGVNGVVFFDTGAVFNSEDAIEGEAFRESAGVGVRWYSPIGPIRVEYGWILDLKEGEDTTGRWAFSMGQAF